jgi:hypothetical protein
MAKNKKANGEEAEIIGKEERYRRAWRKWVCPADV